MHPLSRLKKTHPLIKYSKKRENGGAAAGYLPGAHAMPCLNPITNVARIFTNSNFHALYNLKSRTFFLSRSVARSIKLSRIRLCGYRLFIYLESTIFSELLNFRLLRILSFIFKLSLQPENF